MRTWTTTRRSPRSSATITRESMARVIRTGLSARKFPLLSRIIAVADAYNAMTSDRPYRDAMPSQVARMRLAQAVESQFDTSVTAAFEAILTAADEEYRTGTRFDFGLDGRQSETEPSGCPVFLARRRRRLVPVRWREIGEISVAHGASWRSMLPTFELLLGTTTWHGVRAQDLLHGSACWEVPKARGTRTWYLAHGIRAARSLEGSSRASPCRHAESVRRRWIGLVTADANRLRRDGWRLSALSSGSVLGWDPTSVPDVRSMTRLRPDRVTSAVTWTIVMHDGLVVRIREVRHR